MKASKQTPSFPIYFSISIYCLNPSIQSNHPSTRQFYNKDKKSAEIAKKMEEGVDVSKTGRMDLPTMAWLSGKGDGMGKSLLR